jgi:cellulose synthase/poly-beta-1,6-N-acetylglucosamine synthase-like glycosyltransferase
MKLYEEIFWYTSLAIFVFFVVYTLATLALIAGSLYETGMVKIEKGELFAPPDRRRRPGISVLAPAFNMEPIIVECARSFLASDYDPLEVVIVDDGSTDGTFEALDRAFDLVRLPVGDRFAIETAPIVSLSVSRLDPRLRVVRKENAGRSDAVNAGIDVAQHELVAIVDGDTLLDRDALKRAVEVFAADPDNVVAVGGTIRIANGVLIADQQVTEPRVPTAGIQATQVTEYLRGFLGGRVAWSAMNGLLIISGAFGVFRRDLLRATGGLSKATLGEDMELAMRFHHQLRPDNPHARVAYAADATAWTEIPSGLGPLRGQRIRWHVGLFDNLSLHRKMILRRRFGAVGLASLPYTIAFEVIGPVLQVAGYGILVVLIVLHKISWWYAAAFFVITLLVGQLQTAGAIVIEETGFRRYRTRDLTMLGLWSLLELFWYRPITAWWRTWATFLWLTGRRPGWGTIPRGAAFQEQPEVAAAPLPR